MLSYSASHESTLNSLTACGVCLAPTAAAEHRRYNGGMEYRSEVRELAGYGWVVVVAGIVGRSEGRSGAVLCYGTQGEAEGARAEVVARVVASRARLGEVGDGALPPFPFGGAATGDSVSPVSPA